MLMENIGLIIAVAVVVIVLLWLLFYFVPVGLWFKALLSGVRISLLAAYTDALAQGSRYADSQ